MRQRGWVPGPRLHGRVGLRAAERLWLAGLRIGGHEAGSGGETPRASPPPLFSSLVTTRPGRRAGEPQCLHLCDLGRARRLPCASGAGVGTEDTTVGEALGTTVTLPCRHCYSPKRLNYSLKVSILFIFELMG